MRVLTLNYEYPPLGGGAAPASEELATNLAARGHELDVVTMGYGDLPAEETRNGVRVHRVPALRSSASMSRPHEMASYLVSGFHRAQRLYLDRDHDVVLTHFVVPSGAISYLLARFHGVPYHVVAHGSDVPGYNPDRFSMLHRLTRPAWMRIVAGADTIVSPSEHLRELIRSTSDETSVAVIPNGFDPSDYDPDRPTDERILLTGRLFQRKGVQYVLDALAVLDPDWDVVITGEGPYREPLERKAERLDLDVSFPGWVDRERLTDLLETTALYVFPSSHENCPVALQEAMAAGCAIVASRYGGTAEVVGDAGVLVDPRDTSALAEALETVVEDRSLRARLGSDARARVESRFDWDRIGDAYERILAGEESVHASAGWARSSPGRPARTAGQRPELGEH